MHFVENKIDIMQHVLKIQLISLLPIYIIQISSSVFPHVFAYVNVGHLGDKSTAVAYTCISNVTNKCVFSTK
jgi:hypothetical protein